MMLNKFVIEDWKYVFKDIKLIRFVTKIDVVNDGVKLAELDNDFNISFVSFDKIKKDYGKVVHDDVLKLSGVFGKRFKLKDIVYVRCDELEIACSNLNKMAKVLYEMDISYNQKSASQSLKRLYMNYGVDIEYKGIHFHIVTNEEIYK